VEKGLKDAGLGLRGHDGPRCYEYCRRGSRSRIAAPPSWANLTGRRAWLERLVWTQDCRL
jgi:hypothetical protein